MPYATFLRRFQALLLDAVVYIIASVLIVTIGVALQRASLTGGFALIMWLAFFFLYEPLTVWKFGGTAGHFLLNLRVVDDRTGRNIGLLRAILRYWVKGIVGLFSFVFMAVTQRHQALHDIMTSSTVQIREVSRAEPHHFRSARVPEPAGELPSKWRRVMVILAYSATAFVLAILGVSRYSSFECLELYICTPQEDLFWSLASFGWLAITAVVIIAGWKGRLPGCRRVRRSEDIGAV